MNRFVLLALLLLFFGGQTVFAQPTIDSTSVDKQTVLAAGKHTVAANDTLIGTALYLQKKGDPTVKLPGFINFAALPGPAKTVDWDGQWTGVAAGDWTVTIVIRVLQNNMTKDFEAKTDVTVK